MNNTIFEKNTDVEKVNKLLANFSNELLKKDNVAVGRALFTDIPYFASASLSGITHIEKYVFLRVKQGHDGRYAQFYVLTS